MVITFRNIKHGHVRSLAMMLSAFMSLSDEEAFGCLQAIASPFLLVCKLLQYIVFATKSICTVSELMI